MLGCPQLAWAADPLLARRFEAALLVSGLRFGEFDEHDVAAGLRVGYRFPRAFALEVEMEHSPRGLGNPPFSASRSGVLLRARAGTSRGNWGAFAALGPGLLRFAGAPQPLACIAVFPPPLPCQLAAGRTQLVLGFVGGLLLSPGERLLARFDVEDRLLRYPVAFRRDGRWQHHVRIALGVGLRF